MTETFGGSAPKPPGFSALDAKMAQGGAAGPPAISASESVLRSHPCVALSSARLTMLIGQNRPTLLTPQTLLPVERLISVTTHPVSTDWQ